MLLEKLKIHISHLEKMKKHLFQFIFLTASLVCFGQPDKYAMALMNTPFIAFEAQTVTFRDAPQPAIVILVTADEDAYSKDLKNWLKTRYKIEAKKNSGYNSAVNVIVSEWTPDSINVHYKTDKDGDATKLILLIESKGTFFSELNQSEIISKVKIALASQVRDFYVKYYDKKIEDQQSHYDRQASDLEKLNKKKTKLGDSIKSEKNSIEKNNDKSRSFKSAISASDGKIKSLNSQLQLDQKTTEQAQKEVDAQQKVINQKEVEYNKLNATGELDSKEGVKIIKELEKLRGKQEKLTQKLTNSQSASTKTENTILKEEQTKTKAEAGVESMKQDSDKHESEIRDLERNVSNNEDDIKSKQLLLDVARADLEKLKAAKTILVGAK